MPIYEFYCKSCHTVFSFFTATIREDASPACPKCARPDLPRRPSSFAMLKHRGEDEPDPLEEMLDDERLEGAMETLMGEMGDVDEDDPRAMGRLMRRFSDLTGLELGDQMQEMVRRLEAGDDPDALDEEMDDAFGDDAGFDEMFKLKKALRSRRRKPRVDSELYWL